MKTSIQMDQGFQWWPANPDDLDDSGDYLIELDDKTYEEYQEVSSRYFVLQAQLEHMYRHQHGLTPFDDSPYKNKEI